MSPQLSCCIAPAIAALDASLELQRSGVYVAFSFMPESDTYPDFAYAVNVWASSKQATIEVRNEEHGVMNHVILGGHVVARIHVPNVDKIVVEMPAVAS